MKRYLIRLSKNLVTLPVFFIFPYVLVALGLIDNLDNFSRLFSSGYFLLGLVSVILLDPLIWFTKKRLTFDASTHVEDVERMIAELTRIRRVESKLHGSDDMRFATPSRIRLFRMWKEAITITTTDGVSTMEGNRIVVSRLARILNKQIIQNDL